MERLTDETFDGKVLDAPNTIIVKFTASWCAPCRVFTPILLEAEKDHPKVSFYEIDVEEEPDLAEDYEVRSLPTTLIFKGGVQEAVMKGVVSKNVLYAVISKYEV